jgi:hypothetical protein
MLIPSPLFEKRGLYMNPSIVSRIVSVVPDRTMRLQTGTRFMPPDPLAPGSQIAYLAGFLNWLTPLNAITEDDQRALGVGPHGKLPRHDDDDDADPEHEDSGVAARAERLPLR